MSVTQARTFLDSLSGYTNSPVNGPLPSSDRPVVIGTVDPNYTAGMPRVLFDGETVMSTRGYPWVPPYSPIASDRVILMPVGQSYLIAGKIQTTMPIPKFIPLTLQNGWVNYNNSSGYFYNASVTRTATGMVKVSGLIINGNTATNTVIANLPAPFRPATEMAFTGISNNLPTGINVHPNGDIVIGRNASTAWFSLENIVFNNDPTLVWNTPAGVNGWVGYGGPTTPPQYTKDSLGRVWLRGVMKNPNATAAADQPMFVLPAGYRTALQQHQQTYANGGFAFHDTLNTGEYRWKFGSNTASNQYMYLDDSMFVEASVGGWTNGTYQNGWTSYNSASFPDAGYRKDADGIVHLHGLIHNGTGFPTTIFNLPAGFRPSRTLLHAVASNSAIGRCDIEGGSGNVLAVMGSTGWFSLDGLSFVAEL